MQASVSGECLHGHAFECLPTSKTCIIMNPCVHYNGYYCVKQRIWAQTLRRVHHSFTCTHFRTRVQFLKGGVTISYHPQLFPPAHEQEALPPVNALEKIPCIANRSINGSATEFRDALAL